MFVEGWVPRRSEFDIDLERNTDDGGRGRPLVDPRRTRMYRAMVAAVVLLRPGVICGLILGACCGG